MLFPRIALITLATLFIGCGDAGGGSGDSSGDTSAGASTGDTPTSSGSDDGSGGGTGSGTDPFMVEPMCSSGKMWTQGNLQSPHMHPGMACLTCHSQMEPDVVAEFPLAGTVYPTGHEPDDCLGLDGAAAPTYVEITTADAKVVKLAVNSSGNFVYDVNESGALMFPITAKVVKGDKERPMYTPQMTGDCNSCHTQDGASGAPGRIVEPL